MAAVLKSLHDCVLGMCSAGSSNVNILHPPSHSPVPGPGIPHPSNGRQQTVRAGQQSPPVSIQARPEILRFVELIAHIMLGLKTVCYQRRSGLQ
ncbi:hypothetical protein NQZ68_034483 [Dissostichus eleginoides]|nr:hypothetical protein NQZ68_034483 [Dissostichus eleginoides]